VKAVVLMYHRLGSGPSPAAEPGDEIYCVGEEAFEAHLEALGERPASVARPEALIAAAAGDSSRLPRNAVGLTFDDGNASDLAGALPGLASRGFAAIFFVVPAWVENGRGGHLDWHGVRELKRAGMTIGAHGLDHQRLSTLKPKELRKQMVECRSLLEARLGEAPLSISLPGGAGGKREVVAARSAGFVAVFGSEPARWRVRDGVRGEAPVPRFALRASDRPAWVTALQRHEAHAILRASLRHLAVRVGRAMLGDQAYQALRRRAANAAR